MIELVKGGAYLVNGTDIVEDNQDEIGRAHV